MVSLFTGTVPNLTQSQPDFDTNTQAILDYIASLAPDLNAWVGAYVQDTSSASSTSNTVGTGSKTFTVEAGKGYKVNMPVRASATTGNYMDGIVTAYSGTSLTVNFTAATGSGTFTSWQIFLTIPGSNVTLGSNTFTGDQFVPDEAYDATGWNGDLSVPTKNAVRDKIEAILGSFVNATNDPTFTSISGTTPSTPEWVSGYVGTKAIGIGQTWQNVAASRSYGTTYTNTTGRPIVVSVTSSNGGSLVGSIIFNINGSPVAYQGANAATSGNQNSCITMIVPNGNTYSVTNVNSGSISYWYELR